MLNIRIYSLSVLPDIAKNTYISYLLLLLPTTRHSKTTFMLYDITVFTAPPLTFEP